VGLKEGDAVIGVAVTTGKDEIVLGTANGQAIRFNEADVRDMGRTAAGVRGVHLREGDDVVDMVIVDPRAALLTVCENGYGKRTEFEEYRTQGRGGSGIINIRASDRNGKVVGMKSVHDADELMLITLNGQIVRIGVNEMRSIGRATQGVRVITLKPGDKLVAVARVANEDDGQQDLPLQPPDAQKELPLPRPEPSEEESQNEAQEEHPSEEPEA
jgi:DNA gyrase subunit A